LAVRLFIGNLPYDATDVQLRDHLGTVGQPTHVALPTDRETGRPRGFAFVEFADRGVAEEVIRRLNGQAFRGRPLAVSEARPREDRSGPRPPGPPRSAGPPPRLGDFAGPRLPRAGDAPPAAPAGRARNFGPPAKPKRAGGDAKWRQKSEGPKGPIKVKGGGRIYDVEGEGGSDEPIDFEDFATSLPDEPDDTET
jgi:RNA recognition motif-containing protein